MDIIKDIRRRHDAGRLHDEYSTEMPVPHVYLNDFLSKDLAAAMYKEACTADDSLWTTFDRKGSHMKECKVLEHLPVASQFVNEMHSSLGLEWISTLTGMDGIMGDPYLVGAGYSKSYNGDSLQVHSDFNWQDKLKLHRAASLIVYLTPDWEPEWNGALEFWDNMKEKPVKEFPCIHNSVIIWDYSPRGFHGYPKPISCPADVHRTTFRLFYYYSDAQYKQNDRPHRSLYWYDKEAQEPYDIASRR